MYYRLIMAAADQLYNLYNNYMNGTTVVIHFTYNGMPFRVRFVVNDKDHGYTVMHAYTGSEGEMTPKNRVEYRKIYCHGRTLRQCVEIGLTRRCDVNPKDIRIGEIIPPI